MNETLIWIVLFGCLGLIIYWLRYQESIFLSVVISLISVPSIIFLYVYAHQIYYYFAVNSPKQEHHCGIFNQYQSIEHYSKNGNWTQILYEFKTEQGQIFVFARNRAVAKHLPIMAQIQPNQKICFQYSPNFEDSNTRYLLTGLSLQSK